MMITDKEFEELVDWIDGLNAPTPIVKPSKYIIDKITCYDETTRFEYDVLLVSDFSHVKTFQTFDDALRFTKASEN